MLPRVDIYFTPEESSGNEEKSDASEGRGNLKQTRLVLLPPSTAQLWGDAGGHRGVPTPWGHRHLHPRRGGGSPAPTPPSRAVFPSWGGGRSRTEPRRGSRAPALLEAVGADVPLLQDVHLVLGLLQQEGAGGALAGLGARRFGQLGLGGALLAALLPARRLRVVLRLPQLLFVLHAAVLEPGFHLGRGGKAGERLKKKRGGKK